MKSLVKLCLLALVLSGASCAGDLVLSAQESNVNDPTPIFASEQIADEDIAVHVLSPRSKIDTDIQKGILPQLSNETIDANNGGDLVTTDPFMKNLNNGMIAFDLIISNNDADLLVNIYNDQHEILCQKELEKTQINQSEKRSIQCYFPPELLYEGDNFLYIEIQNVHTREIVFHTISHFFYYNPDEIKDFPSFPMKPNTELTTASSQDSHNLTVAMKQNNNLLTIWNTYQDPIAWSSIFFFAGIALHQLWELQRDEQIVIPFSHPLYPYLPVILRDKQEVGFPLNYRDPLVYSTEASYDDITYQMNSLPPSQTTSTRTIGYQSPPKTLNNPSIETNTIPNPPVPSNIWSKLHNVTTDKLKTEDETGTTITNSDDDDNDDDEDGPKRHPQGPLGSKKGFWAHSRSSVLPKVSFPSLASILGRKSTTVSVTREKASDTTATLTKKSSSQSLPKGWWWKGMIGMGILLLTVQHPIMYQTTTSFVSTSDALWKQNIMPWKAQIEQQVDTFTRQFGESMTSIQTKVQQSFADQYKARSKQSSLTVPYQPRSTDAKSNTRNSLYQVPPILVHESRPRRAGVRPFVSKFKQQMKTIFPSRIGSKHIPLPSSSARTNPLPVQSSGLRMEEVDNKQNVVKAVRSTNIFWRALILLGFQGIFMAAKVAMNLNDNATQILQHIGIFENTYLPV